MKYIFPTYNWLLLRFLPEEVDNDFFRHNTIDCTLWRSLAPDLIKQQFKMYLSEKLRIKDLSLFLDFHNEVDWAGYFSRYPFVEDFEPIISELALKVNRHYLEVLSNRTEIPHRMKYWLDNKIEDIKTSEKGDGVVVSDLGNTTSTRINPAFFTSHATSSSENYISIKKEVDELFAEDDLPF